MKSISQQLLTLLGRNVSRDGGAVNPPVHHSSTILFTNFEELQDFEAGKSSHDGYGRERNPTMRALEEAICAMEGYESTIITSSGLAATITAVLACVGAGEHILVPDSVYATTRKFLKYQAPRLGLEVDFYDPTIGAGIAEFMKPNTKAIYVESPGSLTFEMQDIPAISAVAHQHGAVVIADNTWATPLLVDAPALGIDVSVHSVTKYIAGHSDLVMGAVSANGELAHKIRQFFNQTGMCAGSDNIYLALRGLRTLGVRLERHADNALKVANWLEQHPKVNRVLFPALASHPQHDLFKRDLKGHSSLFAFELTQPSRANVKQFVDHLEHFGLGYSWGGYESLVMAYEPAVQRSATRWQKDVWLIRLHIGLEEAEILQYAIDTALAGCKG